MKTKKQKKIQSKNGITLIALIITIIILLILAGITIYQITENGILEKTKNAKNQSEKSAATEIMQLKITSIQIAGYAENKEMPTLQYASDKLCEDDEIEYVELTKQEASIQKKDIGESKSIFTKLKAYPYQFEIDDHLRLASIDGVKVADANTGTITGGEKKSDIISKLDIAVTVKGTKITINLTPEATDSSKILGYHYFAVNKNNTNEILADITKSSTCTIKGNTASQYSVYAIAYDIYNGYIISEVKNDIVTTSINVELGNKFDKYIYIDATNGNDTSGNGTKQSPYKTLDKIADSGIIENDYSYGIVLKDGTYSLTKKIFELQNCNKSINIIGNRQNTILQVHDLYENSGGGSKKYNVNLYRLVWNGTYGGCNTMFLSTKIKLYNVGFKLDFNSVDYSYFISAVDESSNYEFFNCTLTKKIANLCSVQGSGTAMKLTNCYGGFTSGYATANSIWNYQTNYITDTPNVDSTTYEIKDSDSVWKDVGTGKDLDDSTADLGVYGGEYSWEYKDDID